MLFDGVLQYKIAKKFGVVKSTINCIKLNKSYAEIQIPKTNMNDLLKFNRKLTNNQVLEIRKMLFNGITYKIIAKKFNVTIDNIGGIKRGTNYKDIQLPKEAQ